MAEIQYVPINCTLCDGVAELVRLCFPDMPQREQYSVAELEEIVDIYPEGTVVALDGKRPIGMGTGIFTDLDFANLPPLEDELLYDEHDQLRHNWQGDYYYGSDIAVHPNYRGRGIARKMYEWRKKQVTDHHKKGFAAAAVLPGFANYLDSLTAESYVESVVAGELFDPTLSVQLRNGFHVVRLVHNFFEYPRSKNWSALIRWDNPNFRL